MNALRTSDVTARVVAWHNRHPLARRITPDHVQAVGVVALPLALKTPDGPAAPVDLTPIFDAGWMYRADAEALGDWVRRHGRYPLPACADWPHRQIDADLPRSHAADAAGLDGRTLRHVLTAVVEIGGQRVRVLVAPVAPLARAQVFGSRLYSLPRAAGLAGAGAVAAGLAVAGGLLLRPELPVAPAPAVLAAVPAASAASATLAASAAPAASAVAAIAEPAAPAASAVVQALPDKPLDVDPVLRSRADGAPPLVQIRPRLTEDEQRAARVQAVALRPAPAASAAAATVYAIATPALRTRDDALAQQALLQGLKAQSPTPGPTQLAVMPAQGRWRVVWFPHPVQREAERLIVEARARGLKVELIAF